MPDIREIVEAAAHRADTAHAGLHGMAITGDLTLDQLARFNTEEA